MADKERDDGGADEGAASDRVADDRTPPEEGVREDRPPQRPAGTEEPAPPPNAPPRPAPPPEHVARVLSAHVQDLIDKRLLRAGIPEQDRNDFKQSITEALVFMANPPADLDGCSRAANDITGKQIADARRRDYRRARVNAGPTDQADNHAHDDAREAASGQHAQKVAIVREALADGSLTERDATMLTMKRDGHTDAQIAEKVGIAKQTVSNRIAGARKKVRGKWHARMTQLAAMALAAVLLVLAWRKREEIADLFREPEPAPAPAPAPTKTAPPTPMRSVPVAPRPDDTAPPVPESLKPDAARAEDLRREAREACELGDYATCSARLDAAAKLDPAGETRPEVRELRHTVEDNIHVKRPSGAKTGTRR